jgi:hypothetical protein
MFTLLTGVRMNIGVVVDDSKVIRIFKDFLRIRIKV